MIVLYYFTILLLFIWASKNKKPKEIIIDKPVLLQTEKHIFRPETFGEYIGQERAKKILKTYIENIKKRNKTMPHILIYGKAGMGKTTLARIIANELGVDIIEYIAGDIYTTEQLLDLIHRAENKILFLDEIHALSRVDAEKIYSIMEDFTYNGEPIPKFTLIGATTEIGEIIRNKRPFYDRFKIIIELENYTIDDLSKIIKQYANRVFEDEKIDDNIFTIIAKNSRGTPRTAIRLLEATVYMGDVYEALDSFGIIKNGFTYKDLKILKYIAYNEKGIGLQGLITFLDTSQYNYLYEIEPYLLMTGCIVRTPRGRKITDIGLKVIEMLENEIAVKKE